MRTCRRATWCSVLLMQMAVGGSCCLLEVQPIDSNTKSTIISLYYGAGKGTHDAAEGFGISIQPWRKNLLFTLRHSITVDLDTEICDFALLAGYSSRKINSLAYVSASTGIGYVDSWLIDRKGIGLPVDVQLFFTPVRSFGIGLCGFANVNAIETFYGALLCLQFSFLL